MIQVADTNTHFHVLSLLIGLGTGGGLTRFLVYVSQAAPPLNKDASWWSQFAYNLLKGLSGLDPNSAILTPNAVRALKETGALPKDS